MQNRRLLPTTLALAPLGGAWMVAAAMPQVPVPPPTVPQLTRSGDQVKPVVGTYKLLFKGFDDSVWEAPENQEVTVTKNTTTRRTVTFTRK